MSMLSDAEDDARLDYLRQTQDAERGPSPEPIDLGAEMAELRKILADPEQILLPGERHELECRLRRLVALDDSPVMASRYRTIREMVEDLALYREEATELSQLMPRLRMPEAILAIGRRLRDITGWIGLLCEELKDHGVTA